MTNLKAKLIRLENKNKLTTTNQEVNQFKSMTELNEKKPEEDLNLLFLKKCIDYINTK